MIKPQMPGIPGVGSMADTLDFVKNIWGMMGVTGTDAPGMVVPTVSVEDLDKKIADLKTVESWLNVNMTMLRGTIQALEVQRATIATLKSMGESFSEAVKKARTNDKVSGEYPGFSFPDFSFTPSVRSTTSSSAEAASAAQPPQTVPPDPVSPAEAKKSAAASDPSTALVNPAAWWNILQDQFKHAVHSAVVSEPVTKARSTMPTVPKKAAPASPKKVLAHAPARPKKAKPKVVAK